MIYSALYTDAFETFYPLRIRQLRGSDFIAKTTAHEAGHALSMEHYVPPDPAHRTPSVMATRIRGWGPPPDTYDDVDVAQMRMHRKH